MTTISSIPHRRRIWLAAFAAFHAVAAWAGAIGLITGTIDFGGAIDERLPFASLHLAGLALAGEGPRIWPSAPDCC